MVKEPDIDSDDEIYENFRVIKPSGSRRPLMLLAAVVLVAVLVGVTGYGYANGLLPLTLAGQGEPAPGEPPATEQDAPAVQDAGEAGQPAAVAGVETTRAPEPAAAVAPAEPAEEAAEEEAEPAPEAFRVAPPENGRVLFNRSSAGGEWTDKAGRLAFDMIIREPYDWEYIEYEPGAAMKDVKRYYIQALNQELGYRLVFDDTFQVGIMVIKFKQDGKRITIQFWEEQPNSAPHSLVFYEGW